mgnify:CR=1 FL=1
MNKNICIVHPNPEPKCETFIRAHIENLPGGNSILFGGHMPLYDHSGQELHPGLPADSTQLFSSTGLPENSLHEQAVRNLAEYLTTRNISVVLAEYGPTGVAMIEPCRLAGIPFVVHFHGFDASLKPILKKYRKGYDKLFKQTSAVICVSKEMKKDLLALGAPEERLYVNPYGVDASLFAEAAPESAPGHFIAVGRFVDKKAPETVVCAFSEVTRSIPDTTLTMIGDGALRESCIRLADNLGLSNQVSFPGALEHMEVAQEMRKARCFVQHSVTPKTGDKEGTPNSVLEASASGLPVVATRHAGIVEAVIHKQTGLLCDEYDFKTMAAHMVRIAENPDLAGRLGRAGRLHVTVKYDFESRLSNLASILEETIKRHQIQR